jgi:hypothetical protein
MKKLFLAAVACAALATPALASGTNVTVVLKNTAFVSQGGNGHGQANVAFVAQGAIATIQAPHNLPTVVINTGYVPIGE